MTFAPVGRYANRVQAEKRNYSSSPGPWANPKRRVIGHFPQMTVGIFEVSAIPSPVCFDRFLGYQHTLALQDFKKMFYLFLGFQIMSEGYPVETRAVVLNARILCQFFPSKKPKPRSVEFKKRDGVFYTVLAQR